MFLFYEIAYFVFVVLNIPFLLFRGKWHNRFWMRFGFWPAQEKPLEGGGNIWIHAVSVGEILAVQRMIDGLQQRFPEYGFVISTVTKTGYALAREKFQGKRVIYAPLDFGFSVKSYIRRIRPRIYIAAETEIWPNLFRQLYKSGVPVVLVNGRISQKSFLLYRCISFFLKSVWPSLQLLCVQSSDDAKRFEALGVAPQMITVTGNMKFDGIEAETAMNAEEAGFAKDAAVWVAGSTHPGEEAIVLDVFASLKKKYPDLGLVLAPRHIERCAQIDGIIRRKGFEPVYFSKRSRVLGPQDVLLVDTIGHLRRLYSIAKIVFVGKSLCGYGGQNIIEPASFAKPIIVGMHMENFRDIFAMFLKNAAVIQVADVRQLKRQAEAVLADPQQAFQLGAAAYDIVRNFQGSTERTCEMIARRLKDS